MRQSDDITQIIKPSSRALAAGFIAAFRAHGHEPYIWEGNFAIKIGVRPPAVPHEGDFSLGFDTRPFDALRDDPDYIQHLIDATLSGT